MHYISYWGGRNHIAFVGDSRIRQLYFHFANVLSKSEVKAYKSHSDLRLIDEKLNLEVVSTAFQHCQPSMQYFLKVLKN